MVVASGLLHSAADPQSIAAAIESVPADAWDDDVLERLRTIALELGGDLRRLADATADDADA